MKNRTEYWQRYGKVSVSRDKRGRFLGWSRLMDNEKWISVYGNCMTNEGVSSRRYDIYGKGKELYQAVTQAHKIVPRKRHVQVSAEDFLDDPFTYGTSGYWIDREVES
jgi:hypothetical protein